jgi:putative ABC transport system permease protein
MTTLLDDLRFAVRMLLKGGVTSALTILALAIGIGANTAMFTFIDAMIFRPTNAGDPEELVWLNKGAHGYAGPISAPHSRFAQRNIPALGGVAAWGGFSAAIGGDTPVRAQGQFVTGNYFDVLRVRPVLGRSFAADEDSIAGAKPVIVISHAFWMRRFSGDSSIVNRVIVVNAKPVTVIGVAPPGFGGVPATSQTDCWAPMSMLGTLSPSQADWVNNKDINWLTAIARLRSGMSLAQAQAAAKVASVAINADSVNVDQRELLLLEPAVGVVAMGNRSDARSASALLALVPLLVLLVACANAANMQLAQGVARRREFAVRQAIGATRARMLRQLLTESLLMATLAGALGVPLAWWLTALITRFGSVPAEVSSLLTPSPVVLWLTLAVAAITGVLFGVVPALTATKLSLTPALKDEGLAFGSGRGRHRMRDVLVVGQVACSTILLLVAGLFLRSLDRSMRVDPGFDVARLHMFSFDVGTLGYSDDARTAFTARALESVRALPGVTAAAVTTAEPLGGRMYRVSIQPAGAAPNAQGIDSRFSAIGVRYFETMRMPLVRGRDFTSADNAASHSVTIVDEALAERMWPGKDPIGQRLRFTGDSTTVREVIGVARNSVHGSLQDSKDGFFYLALAQNPPAGSIALLYRLNGSSGAVMRELRTVFRELDPNLPLDDFRSYDAIIENATGPQRAIASALGLFGGLALLLAALGLFGVTAHSVTLRTREIGIRMSLGARKADVLRQFVSEGVRRSLVGIAIGIVVSLGLSRVLRSYLFGLAPTDFVTFVLTSCILAAVAVVATLIPARRAAGVDPSVALSAG